MMGVWHLYHTNASLRQGWKMTVLLENRYSGAGPRDFNDPFGDCRRVYDESILDDSPLSMTRTWQFFDRSRIEGTAAN